MYKNSNLCIFAVCLLSIIVAQPPQGGGNMSMGGGAAGSGCITNGTKCGTTKGTNTMVIKQSGSNYIVTTTSCPGYDWTSQKTPNTAFQQNLTFTIPMTPTIQNPSGYVYPGITGANGASNSNYILGAIGVAVNGVQIYSDSDALGRNAYTYEGVSFDTCGGHPDQCGNYHYHAQTAQGCVYNDTTGQHSPLFGLMFDGVPIYGTLGDNGVVPTNLDTCGGHTDNTYSFYHYHLTANYQIPLTIGCFKGCLFNQNQNGALQSYVVSPSTCSAASTQYSYSSVQSTFTAFSTGFASTIKMTSFVLIISALLSLFF